MKKLYLILIIISLFVTACGGGNDVPASTADLSTCETAGIAEQSTDPNIEQLRQAMLDFRNALSDELRTEASTCLDSERFTLWHNTPNDRHDRGGIQYGDLTDDQIGLFEALVQGFLSDAGYQKVEGIVYHAEGFLKEIDADVWDPNFYSIDLFGDPENGGSWGFQLDGHHLVINFLVHGDHVSMVPAFIGAEPVVGSFNGTDFDVFATERDLAFTLYTNLSDDENSAATSTGDDAELAVGPADRPGGLDPYAGDYDYSGFETGLKFSDMSEATQDNLLALMQAYVYNLETPLADLWWADITSAIDDTYFVWISETDELTNLSFYYYRIYNPHLWVEYNVEGQIGDAVEEGNHAHSITRVPSTSNGGDYGIFAKAINGDGPRTLLEHYAQVDHHALGGMAFDYQLAVLLEHDHTHSD
ncbi:MAG: DUF3500 domain-containing protein [Chloroflexota bacterium]